MNKKCSELWFCHGLSLAEKGEAALELCAALEQLRRTVFCGETDYYLGGFASGMARKLRKAGGDEAVAERLCRIGQDAMERFRAYSESDPAAREVLNCDFMDFP